MSQKWILRRRAWLKAGCCLGVLSAGVALGALQARGEVANAGLRAARPAENITLDVPAGVSLSVVGETLEFSSPSGPGSSREFSVSGGATLTWSNGFRLEVRDAVVSVASTGKDSPTRVFIRPAAGQK